MNPDQVPMWTAAIEQKGEVDWDDVLDGYVAQVDWPGASFWPELSAAYPDALVILSVRDPDVWYTSASNTIFQAFDVMPEELSPWFMSVAAMMGERFSAELGDRDAMIAALPAAQRCGTGCDPGRATPRVVTGTGVGADLRTAGCPGARRTVPGHEPDRGVSGNARRPAVVARSCGSSWCQSSQPW